VTRICPVVVTIAEKSSVNLRESVARYAANIPGCSVRVAHVVRDASLPSDALRIEVER
jgi:hypothetical protein